MKITVVIPDSTVIVDGVARVVEMPPTDPNWRVMRDDALGARIETHYGDAIRDIPVSGFEPFVSAWIAAEPREPSTPDTIARPVAGVREV